MFGFVSISTCENQFSFLWKAFILIFLLFLLMETIFLSSVKYFYPFSSLFHLSSRKQFSSFFIYFHQWKPFFCLVEDVYVKLSSIPACGNHFDNPVEWFFLNFHPSVLVKTIFRSSGKHLLFHLFLLV